MKKANFKQLSCEVPDKDYNLFKSVACLKGVRLNTAVSDAMHLWLEKEKTQLGLKLSEK